MIPGDGLERFFRANNRRFRYHDRCRDTLTGAAKYANWRVHTFGRARR